MPTSCALFAYIQSHIHSLTAPLSLSVSVLISPFHTLPMGKASKWFRGLIALINNNNKDKQCRRWSFAKSYTDKKDFHHHTTTAAAVVDHHDATTTTTYAANKPQQLHVQHNSSSSSYVEVEGATHGAGAIIVGQEWAAAVKIQAAFRGCLARRALGALKGIVMLQALVRGDIHRRRAAVLLQRMRSFLRAQVRAHAVRSQISQASYRAAKPSTGHLFHRNGSKSNVQINGNQDKCGNRSNTSSVEEQSWNQQRSWTRTCSMDDERGIKILEIDSGKPYISSKRKNLFYSTSQPLVWDHYSQSLTTTKDSCQSVSSCEVQSYRPLKLNEVEDNNPQILSNSSKDGVSRKSPFTPTKSDGSRSYLSGYSDYPSYMAYTESSKAKVRSISAPKQRSRYERCSSVNRYSLQ
ncbi:hypothetical protein RIF29_37412 [Crotalaria pallida]|uniref:DUF4005 domain-containing protein n=1 Tax=Crotalaria pallida TaxID=3830 RepID=A0AAN9HV55_CROPI